jgi:hypothetical protein
LTSTKTKQNKTKQTETETETDGAELHEENAFETFAAESLKANTPLAQDSSRKRTEKKDSSNSSGSKEKRTKQHRGGTERSPRSLLSQQPHPTCGIYKTVLPWI